jgi:hypothetical protein
VIDPLQNLLHCADMIVYARGRQKPGEWLAIIGEMDHVAEIHRQMAEISMEQEIKALKKRGYQVEELTPYQFRVECVLDLYPVRRRFHNIANQERGEYPNYPMAKMEKLIAFVDEQVKAADDLLDAAIKAGAIPDHSDSGNPTERRRWLSTVNPVWWSKCTKAGA